ncbi:MAG: acyltransferase [Acidobacteriota bacterium]
MPALTGLRFLLAVWVILHHIAGKGMMLEAWTLSLSPLGQSLILGGYLAVQTFFVLSGFVLARSYSGSKWKRGDLVTYFAARFARIYPVYALSLLVVSPFIFDAMMRTTRTLALKSGLLFDYAFVLQGWYGNLGVGWNTPAWTLSCEFFFYLLFPAVFLLLRDAGRLMLGAVLALAVVTPVLLAHAGVPWTWKPIYHFSDFAAGIVAARLFERTDWRFLRRRGAWLYLPALVGGAFLIAHPAFMEGVRILGWGGDVNTGLRPLNVLALLGLGLGTGFAARVLASPLVEYLGKASYSMYILHVPVLWWYSKWAMYQRHMPRPVAATLYLALVIAVSALAFELVEKPANRWIRMRVAARQLC